jgi:hypothetical protein
MVAKVTQQWNIFSATKMYAGHYLSGMVCTVGFDQVCKEHAMSFSLDKVTGIKTKSSTEQTSESVLCYLYYLLGQMDSQWDCFSEIIKEIRKEVYIFILHLVFIINICKISSVCRKHDMHI